LLKTERTVHRREDDAPPPINLVGDAHAHSAARKLQPFLNLRLHAHEQH
jgi:hypothetical protein